LSAASIENEGYARCVRPAEPVVVLALLLAAGCGGKSVAEHQRELYTQKCAACHGVGPDSPTPVAAAPNLLAGGYTVEQVRRAVIDGRPGMPKGLLGGSDVDEIATYVAEAGR
jgi:mono/diheme cytochrome c family protein